MVACSEWQIHRKMPAGVLGLRTGVHMEIELICSRCGATLDASMVPPGKVEVEPCECCKRDECVAIGPDYDEARTLRTVWGQRL